MTIFFEATFMLLRQCLFTKKLCITSLILLTSLVSLNAHAIDTTKYHAQPKYAVAMHGQPKYPEGFKHLNYVNPNAPKGGELRQGVVSNGYDSFNGFILKGVPAEGLGMIYDTLAYASEDEPFTEYGLVAEKIEMPKDRSWVRFYINPKAHFNDGVPITAKDVKFTFDTLMKKGSPGYKVYYSDVKEAIVESKYKIIFLFKTNKNKELPLILGQLPVLPEHYWKNKDFNKTTLTPPLGSGPYKIKSFEPGRNIVYERVKNYWGKNLPVNVGRFNFNNIDFEYFGDQTIALEAFKAGRYDVRIENVAKSWATAYKGDKFDKGIIKKEEVRNKRPTGMQAFIFNTRRDIFKQRQVREALNYAFDFEWTNKQLFYSQYTRTKSFFDNSDLASSGLPSQAELKILNPYKKQLPPRLFKQPFKVPETNGSGNIRGNLRIAMRILHNAGWHIKNGKLTNDKTGEILKFEILLYSKAFERVVLPFVKNLKTLGVQATVRLVDTNQYIQRLRNFDYDMIITTIPEGNSPGNEQKNYWTTQAANIQGSGNYSGINNPIVDDLVKHIVLANDRKDLVNYTRALDRVLLWNFYVIPQWHIEIDRVAYWNKLHHPATFSDQGVNFDSWWSTPDSEH
jgi:microcin C transport system substrate-binding protein